jgi:hypothetical protein
MGPEAQVGIQPICADMCSLKLFRLKHDVNPNILWNKRNIGTHLSNNGPSSLFRTWQVFIELALGGHSFEWLQ